MISLCSMKETLTNLNHTLETIRRWSETWQVTLAPQKTQALYITKRNMPNDLGLQMGGAPIEFAREINILGLNIDSGLTFVNHVKEISSRAGRKLTCIRRISNILDANSIKVLYNSQVLPLMEYCPLSWNGCPKSHLQRLDGIRDRAQRLINWKRSMEDSQITLQQLQHRRDVSAMCVFYKIHKMGVEHLHSLRGIKALPLVHNLRRSSRREEEISVPRSRTEQHLRRFVPKLTGCGFFLYEKLG